MRFPIPAGLLLAVAPFALSAQNCAPGAIPNQGAAGFAIGHMEKMGPDGQTTPAKTPPQPNLCPVALSAQHLSDGEMIETAAAHSKGQGQWLHLTLHSPDARTIASAKISVRGCLAKAHVEQTTAGDANVSAVRIVDIPFTAGQGKTASADLWARGLSAVDSIDLLSVKFSDGSTWTQPAGNACRVVPNPMMRIGAR